MSQNSNTNINLAAELLPAVEYNLDIPNSQDVSYTLHGADLYIDAPGQKPMVLTFVGPLLEGSREFYIKYSDGTVLDVDALRPLLEFSDTSEENLTRKDWTVDKEEEEKDLEALSDEESSLDDEKKGAEDEENISEPIQKSEQVEATYMTSGERGKPEEETDPDVIIIMPSIISPSTAPSSSGAAAEEAPPVTAGVPDPDVGNAESEMDQVNAAKVTIGLNEPSDTGIEKGNGVSHVQGQPFGFVGDGPVNGTITVELELLLEKLDGDGDWENYSGKEAVELSFNVSVDENGVWSLDWETIAKAVGLTPETVRMASGQAYTASATLTIGSSSKSAEMQGKVDTTPAKTYNCALNKPDDQGWENDDNITNVTQPILEGRVGDNQFVRIYYNGTQITDASGSSQTVAVHFKDASGNVAHYKHNGSSSFYYSEQADGSIVTLEADTVQAYYTDSNNNEVSLGKDAVISPVYINTTNQPTMTTDENGDPITVWEEVPVWTQANSSGHWALLPDNELAEGRHDLHIEVLTESGLWLDPYPPANNLLSLEIDITPPSPGDFFLGGSFLLDLPDAVTTIAEEAKVRTVDETSTTFPSVTFEENKPVLSGEMDVDTRTEFLFTRYVVIGSNEFPEEMVTITVTAHLNDEGEPYLVIKDGNTNIEYIDGFNGATVSYNEATGHIEWTLPYDEWNVPDAYKEGFFQGNHEVTHTTTDIAGNEVIEGPIGFNVNEGNIPDLGATTILSVELLGTDDTSTIDPGNGFTKNDTFNIIGKSPSGYPLDVTLKGMIEGIDEEVVLVFSTEPEGNEHSVVLSNGQWSITDTQIITAIQKQYGITADNFIFESGENAGTGSFIVDAVSSFVDEAGEQLTDSLTVDVNTNKPESLLDLRINEIADKGIFNDDAVTNATTPTISGQGGANEYVRVFYLKDQVVDGVLTKTPIYLDETWTQADESGNWNVYYSSALPPLVDGNYALYVETMTPHGIEQSQANTSLEYLDKLDIVIDTVDPLPVNAFITLDVGNDGIDDFWTLPGEGGYLTVKQGNPSVHGDVELGGVVFLDVVGPNGTNYKTTLGPLVESTNADGDRVAIATLGNKTLEFDIKSDNVTVDWELTYADWGPVSAYPGGLPKGEFTFNIYVEDLAGNASDTESIILNVDYNALPLSLLELSEDSNTGFAESMLPTKDSDNPSLEDNTTNLSTPNLTIITDTVSFNNDAFVGMRFQFLSDTADDGTEPTYLYLEEAGTDRVNPVVAGNGWFAVNQEVPNTDGVMATIFYAYATGNMGGEETELSTGEFLKYFTGEGDEYIFGVGKSGELTVHAWTEQAGQLSQETSLNITMDTTPPPVISNVENAGNSPIILTCAGNDDYAHENLYNVGVEANFSTAEATGEATVGISGSLISPLQEGEEVRVQVTISRTDGGVVTYRNEEGEVLDSTMVKYVTTPVKVNPDGTWSTTLAHRDDIEGEYCLSNGIYTISVQVQDKAGNWAPADSLDDITMSFQGPPLPPTVEFPKSQDTGLDLDDGLTFMNGALDPIAQDAPEVFPFVEIEGEFGSHVFVRVIEVSDDGDTEVVGYKYVGQISQPAASGKGTMEVPVSEFLDESHISQGYLITPEGFVQPDQWIIENGNYELEAVTVNWFKPGQEVMLPSDADAIIDNLMENDGQSLDQSFNESCTLSVPTPQITVSVDAELPGGDDEPIIVYTGDDFEDTEPTFEEPDKNDPAHELDRITSELPEYTGEVDPKYAGLYVRLTFVHTDNIGLNRTFDAEIDENGEWSINLKDFASDPAKALKDGAYTLEAVISTYAGRVVADVELEQPDRDGNYEGEHRVLVDTSAAGTIYIGHRVYNRKLGEPGSSPDGSGAHLWGSESIYLTADIEAGVEGSVYITRGDGVEELVTKFSTDPKDSDEFDEWALHGTSGTYTYSISNAFLGYYKAADGTTEVYVRNGGKIVGTDYVDANGQKTALATDEDGKVIYVPQDGNYTIRVEYEDTAGNVYDEESLVTLDRVNARSGLTELWYNSEEAVLERDKTDRVNPDIDHYSPQSYWAGTGYAHLRGPEINQVTEGRSDQVYFMPSEETGAQQNMTIKGQFDLSELFDAEGKPVEDPFPSTFNVILYQTQDFYNQYSNGSPSTAYKHVKSFSLNDFIYNEDGSFKETTKSDDGTVYSSEWEATFDMSDLPDGVYWIYAYSRDATAAESGDVYFIIKNDELNLSIDLAQPDHFDSAEHAGTLGDTGILGDGLTTSNTPLLRIQGDMFASYTAVLQEVDKTGKLIEDNVAIHNGVTKPLQNYDENFEIPTNYALEGYEDFQFVDGSGNILVLEDGKYYRIKLYGEDPNGNIISANNPVYMMNGTSAGGDFLTVDTKGPGMEHWDYQFNDAESGLEEVFGVKPGTEKDPENVVSLEKGYFSGSAEVGSLIVLQIWEEADPENDIEEGWVDTIQTMVTTGDVSGTGTWRLPMGTQSLPAALNDGSTFETYESYEYRIVYRDPAGNLPEENGQKVEGFDVEFTVLPPLSESDNVVLIDSRDDAGPEDDDGITSEANPKMEVETAPSTQVTIKVVAYDMQGNPILGAGATGSYQGITNSKGELSFDLDDAFNAQQKTALNSAKGPIRYEFTTTYFNGAETLTTEPSEYSIFNVPEAEIATLSIGTMKIKDGIDLEDGTEVDAPDLWMLGAPGASSLLNFTNAQIPKELIPTAGSDVSSIYEAYKNFSMTFTVTRYSLENGSRINSEEIEFSFAELFFNTTGTQFIPVNADGTINWNITASKLGIEDEGKYEIEVGYQDIYGNGDNLDPEQYVVFFDKEPPTIEEMNVSLFTDDATQLPHDKAFDSDWVTSDSNPKLQMNVANLKFLTIEYKNESGDVVHSQQIYTEANPNTFVEEESLRTFDFVGGDLANGQYTVILNVTDWAGNSTSLECTHTLDIQNPSTMTKGTDFDLEGLATVDGKEVCNKNVNLTGKMPSNWLSDGDYDDAEIASEQPHEIIIYSSTDDGATQSFFTSLSVKELIEDGAIDEAGNINYELLASDLQARFPQEQITLTYGLRDAHGNITMAEGSNTFVVDNIDPVFSMSLSESLDNSDGLVPDEDGNLNPTATDGITNLKDNTTTDILFSLDGNKFLGLADASGKVEGFSLFQGSTSIDGFTVVGITMTTPKLDVNNIPIKGEYETVIVTEDMLDPKTGYPVPYNKDATFSYTVKVPAGEIGITNTTGVDQDLYLDLKFTDKAGNATSEYVEFTIDTKAPTVDEYVDPKTNTVTLVDIIKDEDNIDIIGEMGTTTVGGATYNILQNLQINTNSYDDFELGGTVAENDTITISIIQDGTVVGLVQVLADKDGEWDHSFDLSDPEIYTTLFDPENPKDLSKLEALGLPLNDKDGLTGNLQFSFGIVDAAGNETGNVHSIDVAYDLAPPKASFGEAYTFTAEQQEIIIEDEKDNIFFNASTLEEFFALDSAAQEFILDLTFEEFDQDTAYTVEVLDNQDKAIDTAVITPKADFKEGVTIDLSQHLHTVSQREGIHMVIVAITDEANNTTYKEVAIHLDSTAPEIQAIGKVEYDLVVDDNNGDRVDYSKELDASLPAEGSVNTLTTISSVVEDAQFTFSGSLARDEYFTVTVEIIDKDGNPIEVNILDQDGNPATALSYTENFTDTKAWSMTVDMPDTLIHGEQYSVRYKLSDMAGNKVLFGDEASEWQTIGVFKADNNAPETIASMEVDKNSLAEKGPDWTIGNHFDEEALQQLISGTAEPNSTIEIWGRTSNSVDDLVKIERVEVDAQGNWKFDAGDYIDDNPSLSYTFEAYVTDQYGNRNDNSISLTVNRDYTKTIINVTEDENSDIGLMGTDKDGGWGSYYTETEQPELQIKVEPYSKVQIYRVETDEQGNVIKYLENLDAYGNPIPYNETIWVGSNTNSDGDAIFSQKLEFLTREDTPHATLYIVVTDRGGNVTEFTQDVAVRNYAGKSPDVVAKNDDDLAYQDADIYYTNDAVLSFELNGWETSTVTSLSYTIDGERTFVDLSTLSKLTFGEDGIINFTLNNLDTSTLTQTGEEIKFDFTYEMADGRSESASSTVVYDSVAPDNLKSPLGITVPESNPEFDVDPNHFATTEKDFTLRGFTTGSFKIFVDIIDPVTGESNLVEAIVDQEAGTWELPSSVTGDGDYKYIIYGEDFAGNRNEGTEITVTVDSETPNVDLGAEVRASSYGDVIDSTYYSGAQTLYIDSEGGAGLEDIEYVIVTVERKATEADPANGIEIGDYLPTTSMKVFTKADGSWTTAYPFPDTAEDPSAGNGSYKVTVTGYDGAGNTNPQIQEFIVERNEEELATEYKLDNLIVTNKAGEELESDEPHMIHGSLDASFTGPDATALGAGYKIIVQCIDLRTGQVEKEIALDASDYSGGKWQANFTDLTVTTGSYYVKASIVDKFGNGDSIDGSYVVRDLDPTTNISIENATDSTYFAESGNFDAQAVNTKSDVIINGTNAYPYATFTVQLFTDRLTNKDQIGSDYEVTVNADGTWSLTVPSGVFDSLPDGTRFLVEAQNTSVPSEWNATLSTQSGFIIDTEADGIILNAPTTSESGKNVVNFVEGEDYSAATNSSSINITGTLEESGTVALYVGDTLISDKPTYNGLNFSFNDVDLSIYGEDVTFTLKSVDALGHETEQELELTITGWKEPTIEVVGTDKPDVLTVVDNDKDLQLLINPHTDVSSITIEINGQTYIYTSSGVTGNAIFNKDSNGIYTVTIMDDIPANASGYPFKVTVEDFTGNSGFVDKTLTVLEPLEVENISILTNDDTSNFVTDDDYLVKDNTPRLQLNLKEGDTDMVSTVTAQVTKVGASGVMAGSVTFTDNVYHWDSDAELSDGNYTIVYTITDKYGNETKTNGQAFTVDTDVIEGTIPTLTGAESAQYLTAVAGSTTFITGGQVAANQKVLIPLKVNGIENDCAVGITVYSGNTRIYPTADNIVTTQSANGTWSANLDWSAVVGSGLLDGNYTIKLEITDKAGNTETVDAYTVTHDTTAPSIAESNFTVEDTGTIYNDEVTVKGSINSGYSDVHTVRMYDQSGRLLASTTVDQTNGKWTMPQIELPEGQTSATYTFGVVDKAGNEQKLALEHTVSEDNSAPVDELKDVSMSISPVDTDVNDAIINGSVLDKGHIGTINQDNSFTLNLSNIDAEITHIQITNAAGDIIVVKSEVTPAAGSTGTWSYTFENADLTDGGPFRVYAFDKDGNSTKDSNAFLSFDFDYDGTDPDLLEVESIKANADDVTYTDFTQTLYAGKDGLNFTVSENSTFEIFQKLDSGALESKSVGSSIAGKEWTVTNGLIEGNHNYVLRVTDEAGNTVDQELTINYNPTAIEIELDDYSYSLTLTDSTKGIYLDDSDTWHVSNDTKATLNFNNNIAAGVLYIVTVGSREYVFDANTTSKEITLDADVELKVVDANGNTSSNTLTLETVLLDNTGPTIELDDTAILSGTTYYTNKNALNFKISDTAGTPIVSCTIDGDDVTINKGVISLPLTSGNNTYTIKAIDAAGNETEESVTISYDTILPTFSHAYIAGANDTWILDEDSSFTTGNDAVRLKFSETVQISMNGNLMNGGSYLSEHSITFTETGTYEIEMKDLAGNTSTHSICCSRCWP